MSTERLRQHLENYEKQRQKKIDGYIRERHRILKEHHKGMKRRQHDEKRPLKTPGAD